MLFNFWCLSVFLIGLLATAPIANLPASAATLAVTDLGDTGAPGQLRPLINAAAPGDTIVIPPGIITLITFANEDANVTGDLDIHKDLTIQGAGAGSTVLDGGGGDRVIDIFAPATVMISNVTIQNGGFGSQGGGGIRNAGTLTLIDVTVSGNFSGPQFQELGLQNITGGGILNTGTMTLTNCTITGNTATFGRGGGIANTGTMTLTNVTLNANTVANGESGGGGGIANTGMLTLINVSVNGNSAPLGGGIFNGGTFASATSFGIVITRISGTISLSNAIVSNNIGSGIFNFAGTATLTDVTVADNTSDVGGGINNVRDSTANLTNVTVSGNKASGTFGFGGGIANTGTLSLTNVTVSGNSAQSGGGGIANFVIGENAGGISTFFAGAATLVNVTISGNTGGGILGVDNSSFGEGASSAQLKNTIVAGNPSEGNCSGNPRTITSLGHNLDSGSSCGFTGTGDLSNADPKLAPLQNYGGLTRTHALLAGSPAIDAGDNASCPATDQRGVARPQGTTCDIGAYEFGLPTAGVGLNGSAFQTGQTITYQATLIPGFTETQVDIYLGFLLPDGVTLVSLVQGSPGVISIVLGPLPIPFQANVPLTQMVVPFSYTFAGREPVGTYFTYAGLAVAGSNPLVPSNQLALGVQGFTFTP